MLLKKAKNAGKNRVCALLGNPLTWDRFKARLDDAEWVHAQLNGRQPVSSGFVYRIMEIARDLESVDQGMVGKAGWRAKLAYHLARNIKAKSDQERQQRTKEWLERLGLDDMLKLTKGQSNITDWRLPLSIALYRNR
jgi:CRISPR-associated protein Csm1